MPDESFASDSRRRPASALWAGDLCARSFFGPPRRFQLRRRVDLLFVSSLCFGPGLQYIAVSGLLVGLTRMGEDHAEEVYVSLPARILIFHLSSSLSNLLQYTVVARATRTDYSPVYPARSPESAPS